MECLAQMMKAVWVVMVMLCLHQLSSSSGQVGTKYAEAAFSFYAPQTSSKSKIWLIVRFKSGLKPFLFIAAFKGNFVPFTVIKIFLNCG